MSGGSKGGIGNYIVDRPYGPSCHLAVPLARLLLGDRERCRQIRRSGHQVTMSGGSALQGTCVCVARAPIGARLPPLPAENLEISPPRSLNCAADCIRYDPGRDTCAPGARPHPPRRSHHRPSRHLVVYRIRSGPVPAGDSFQYQGCQTSIFSSRACPDTSSLMSSARVPRRACRPVRAVCAAARRETRQPGLPRDFCPTLPPWRAFCSPVWFGGVTALHKIRS